MVMFPAGPDRGSGMVVKVIEAGGDLEDAVYLVGAGGLSTTGDMVMIGSPSSRFLAAADVDGAVADQGLLEGRTIDLVHAQEVPSAALNEGSRLLENEGI